jgi:pimeloyl-ACP methyl ester carboxylesterase
MPNPLILIHGYSDKGESFQTWKKRLAPDYPAELVHIVTYESLTDEVTLKDIAEGFDRALRLKAAIKDDQDFDVMVHSTGMLIIRCWLTNYPQRRSRLKRIIGLAPATFGSPLAHTGRSTLGAIFKGNRTLGADFLEAGKEVLYGLELASKFTWDLAHLDLIGSKPFYGPEADTPYVFILCGNKAYGGMRRLVNQPGTDGTVRLAGCALNTRKITIDLTQPPIEGPVPQRIKMDKWSNINMPVHLVPELNHGTIITHPSADLVSRVQDALKVNSLDEFNQWNQDTEALFSQKTKETPRFQQFVVRAIDERGDGIQDYNLQLLTHNKEGEMVEINDFDLDVHVYSRDKSLRCFHVDLDALKLEGLKKLFVQVIANTNSRLVGYLGYESDASLLSKPNATLQTVTLDISAVLERKNFTLFYPFTTTLVEFKFNREPLPLDKANEVCWFI